MPQCCLFGSDSHLLAELYNSGQPERLHFPRQQPVPVMRSLSQTHEEDFTQLQEA